MSSGKPRIARLRHIALSRWKACAIPDLAPPDAEHRWRCAQCGNLTRFDVVRRSRTREYWHVDLSGAPTIESSDAIEEAVESVSCRWCGTGGAIEVVTRPGAGA